MFFSHSLKGDAMFTDRRDFLRLTSAIAASALIKPAAGAAMRTTIKAVAFDAFPIFDPRPVFALAETLFPGSGAELSNAWRTRQFEYQWLRALSGRYADFWRATEDSLVFAARMLKLELTAEKRDRLMAAYLELKAWPDAAPALRALKNAGLRLAFLSNATPGILDAGIRNSGLDNLFEHVISTHQKKTFKPAPAAYQLGVDTLRLAKEEICFVAFAGWDAAGAKWFGFPTFWVNRLGIPMEELDAQPDGTGKNLDDLMAFIRRQRV